MSDDDDRGEYTEMGNILNIALAVKLEGEQYVIAAAWLEQHDGLISELLASSDVDIVPGKRYSTTGRSGSVHFIGDGGRVFVCVTKEGYPARVAHSCLEEFQDHVLLSPHNAATTATPCTLEDHELSEALLPILDDLVDKYDDPAEVDALLGVRAKVEVTTSVMQENISLLLENDEQIHDIEGKAEDMTNQAERFKSSSEDLKKKMWWKLCKMRMIYAAIVLGLLGVIIVPVIVYSSRASGGGGGETAVVHKGGTEREAEGAAAGTNRGRMRW